MGVHVSDWGTENPSGSESDRSISTAILLCGGRGTRLGGDVEKPLVEVGGIPLVDRVVMALAASSIEHVVAIPSPHTPETTRHLQAFADRQGMRNGDSDAARVSPLTLDVHVGTGEGYVPDLTHGLSVVGRPAVTVAADLPLLCGSDIDAAIRAATGSGTEPPHSVTVCVPTATKRALGVSVGSTITQEGTQVAPTGLNVVAGEMDRVLVRDRDALAVNVNRPADLGVARRLIRERG